MIHRAIVATMSLVLGMMGISCLSIPSPDLPDTFTCESAADCLDGYDCADGFCAKSDSDASSAADDGDQNTDVVE